MKRRSISIILVLCLLISVLPAVTPEVKSAVAGDGTYIWPVDAKHKISTHNYYSDGTYHGAVDMALPIGSPVYAVAAGKVVKAQDYGCQGSHGAVSSGACSKGTSCAAYKASPNSNGSYANWIIIDHGNNVYSLYAHLKTGSFTVAQGQTVQQGQRIASSGNAGNTRGNNGAHLHFELRMGANSDKNRVDPEKYLTQTNTAGPRPVDLGDDFYAVILNTACRKPITYNEDGFIRLGTEVGKAHQLWRFDRQEDGCYVITSCHNGLALEMHRGDTTSGNPVAARNEDWGGNYQRWYIYKQGDGYVFQSKHYSDMNLVLNLQGGSSEDGTAVTTKPRTNNSHQIWSIYAKDDVQLSAPKLSVDAGTSASKTTFSWKSVYGEKSYDVKIWEGTYWDGDPDYTGWNVYSGWGIQLPAGTYQAYVDAANYYECKMSNVVTFTVEQRGGPIEGLDIGSDFYACIINSSQWRHVTNDGDNVTLRSGTGAENQIWRFAYQGDGYYKIYSCSDGKALDVYGAYSESGTNVWTYPDHEDDAQLWMLTGRWNGDITIEPKCSTCVLDVADGSTHEGVNMQIWTRNGSDAQLFHLWTDLSKTVSYNANGGTGAPPEQSAQYMSTVKLSTEKPTRTGYTFLGWATSANSTSATYQPGDSLTISGNVRESITLYAVWKEGCSGEHSYSYKVNVTPTQNNEGAIIGECKNCPNTAKVTLPKLNMTDYTYTVQKAATCTTNGTGRYTWKNTTYGTYYFDVTINKTGHIEVTDAAVPATCVKTGLTEGKHCSVCGTVLVAQKETAALGHSYGAWAESKAATCAAKGQEKRDCTRCDHYETREIPALGHNYSEKVTAPTCTEKGHTTYTCTRCGNSYTGNEKAALDHAWDSGKVTTEPTEEKEGALSRTCTRCGETKTEAIPALDLDHKHNHKKTVTAPTCTEKGYTTYSCTGCDDSYQADETAALGHNYAEKVTVPTCTAEGYTTYTCTRCGNTYTGNKTAVLGHDYTEKVTTPTCTEEGVTTYTCTRCSNTYTGNEIKALGHDYDEKVTAPTCTDKGYTTYTCTRCGNSDTGAEKDALNHAWDEGKVTTEPTEEKEGVRTKTCTRCGETKIETIPPKDHEHSYTVIITKPTCTEVGYTTYICTCDDSYRSDETAALGHDYSEKVTAPTCTEKGYTTYTCTRCGNSDTGAEKEKLGHAWDDGKVTTEPTEEKEGVRTKTCTRCGETKTESIPPKDHIHDYTVVITDPTCTEAGYTTHTCTCGESYTDTYTDALKHSYTDGLCVRCDAVDPDYEKPGHICPSVGFSDVPAYGNWAHDGIDYCVEHELMNGIGNGLFDPNGTVSRAQLVTILYRVAGSPQIEFKGTFTDVPDGKWYSKAIEWAAANGVVNGIGGGKFSPDQSITREQIATILYRYENQPAVSGSLDSFPDKGNVSGFAVNAMLWATSEKLINGVSSGGVTTLAPKSNATRAQIAAIIMRYLEA